MSRPEPLRLTFARWYNKRNPRQAPDGERYFEWVKALADTGPLVHYPYGSDTPSYGRRGLQACIICAPHTGVIALDVDAWSRLAAAPLGRLLAGHWPISAWRSGEKRHYLIDARAVPAWQWPTIGHLYGDKTIGTLKSNGWVPVPGSEHYDGEPYAPVLRPDGRTHVITATPELMAVIEDAVSVPNIKAPAGSHGGSPCHDSEIAGRVLGWMRQGKTEAECYELWQQVAIPQDPSRPFDRGDFERHYGSALRKAAAQAELDRQILKAIQPWLRTLKLPPATFKQAYRQALKYGGRP